jgi:hypothetical protein
VFLLLFLLAFSIELVFSIELGLLRMLAIPLLLVGFPKLSFIPLLSSFIPVVPLPFGIGIPAGIGRSGFIKGD